MCFWSLRRLKIYFLRRSYLKWGRDDDKVPLKLQDCLDKPAIKKSSFCRPYIFIVLFGLIVFYMYYFQEETRNIQQLGPRPVFMEIYPKYRNNFVTKKVSNNINKLFNNVSLKTADQLNYTKQWYDFKRGLKNITVKMPRNGKIQKKVTRCVVGHKGNVTIHTSKISSYTDLHSEVLMGGYYKPQDCRPQHKVGILVPYRDKEKQLSIFLFNIHPFLINQKIEYRIFVVEQLSKDIYNRGRLLNVGFIEMQKLHKWNCVVFHDSDLLPLDDRIQYSCPQQPRHLCATIEGLANKTTSRSLFGGATIMSLKHFKEVNGFSNLYWGLGGEDNDLFWRLKAVGLGVTRLNRTVARYTSLSRTEPALNPHRFQLLSSASTRYREDGLSNIEYGVISYHLRHLYTHLVVDINPKKENITEATKRSDHGFF